jgi:6-phosphogluconolactonase
MKIAGKSCITSKSATVVEDTLKRTTVLRKIESLLLVLVFGVTSGCGGTNAVDTGSPAPGPGGGSAGGSTGGNHIVQPSKFLYVSNIGENSISGFAIDPHSGALGPVPGSPFQTPGPEELAVDSTGNFLVVANQDNQVSVFRIDDNTGEIAPVAGSPFPSVENPFRLVLYKNSAYVSSRSSEQLAAYSLDPSTGALSPFAGSPIFTEVDGITAIALDLSRPPAVWLDVAGRNGIKFFRADTDGRLADAGLGLYSVGSADAVEAMAAVNGFLYLVQPDNIIGFDERHGEDFLQNLIAGSPFSVATSPNSIATDSSGTFAVVTDKSSGTVTICSISKRGSLFADTDISLGTSPISSAIDASGHFVYVVYQDTNSVYGNVVVPCRQLECDSAFLDRSVTGPFPVGKGATFLTTTPSP